MNILITSAGRRVSLVRAFQKELSLLFPQGKVYTADMQPGMAAACIVSDGAFPVKRVTDPDYIPELLALCRAEDIRMVIPTIDTELQVLAEHKERFQAEGIHLIVPSKDFVDQCRDKRKINRFFEAQGIDIPAAVNKQRPTFPLFIKPYDGSLSADTFLIRRPEELTPYHFSNEKLMFMEYIDKECHDEYTVDMYYGADGAVKCIVPRKRIEIRGGEVSKGITTKNSIIPYLKEKLGRIPGAAGCLTLQLFLNRDTGRIIGIEINPRFGGGFPLSYLAGGNFPGWLIREYFLEEPIHYAESWNDQLLMLRYDDEVLVHQHQPEKALC